MRYYLPLPFHHMAEDDAAALLGLKCTTHFNKRKVDTEYLFVLEDLGTNVMTEIPLK